MGKIGFKNPQKIQLKYEFLLSRVGGVPPSWRSSSLRGDFRKLASLRTYAPPTNRDWKICATFCCNALGDFLISGIITSLRALSEGQLFFTNSGSLTTLQSSKDRGQTNPFLGETQKSWSVGLCIFTHFFTRSWKRILYCFGIFVLEKNPIKSFTCRSFRESTSDLSNHWPCKLCARVRTNQKSYHWMYTTKKINK